DRVLAATARYEAALAELEALNRQIQALPEGAHGRSVARLSERLEESRVRCGSTLREVERETALRAARRAIPPLSEGDPMSNVFGAVARGELRHEATYRPDRQRRTYWTDGRDLRPFCPSCAEHEFGHRARRL